MGISIKNKNFIVYFYFHKKFSAQNYMPCKINCFLYKGIFLILHLMQFTFLTFHFHFIDNKDNPLACAVQYCRANTVHYKMYSIVELVQYNIVEYVQYSIIEYILYREPNPAFKQKLVQSSLQSQDPVL